MCGDCLDYDERAREDVVWRDQMLHRQAGEEFERFPPQSPPESVDDDLVPMKLEYIEEDDGYIPLEPVRPTPAPQVVVRLRDLNAGEIRIIDETKEVIAGYPNLTKRSEARPAEAWQQLATAAYPDRRNRFYVPHTHERLPQAGLYQKSWNQRWKAAHEELLSYPDIWRRIVPGVPVYSPKRRGHSAMGAYFKVTRALTIIQACIPVTETSQTFSGGYHEWVLYTTKCQARTAHHSADTYCPHCLSEGEALQEEYRKQQETPEQWRLRRREE
jgi:hypothetical protein